MLNNFTPRAQQALAFAKKEADNLSDNYIGTHHLLIGILKLSQGVASTVLQALDIKTENIFDVLQSSLNESSEENILANKQTTNSQPYSLKIKQAISFAQEEARSLSHNYIGTEHLILGITKDPNNNASKILSKFDITFKEIKKEILKELDPSQQSGEEPVLAGTQTETKSNNKKKTLIKQYTTDLTELAKNKKIDPVIGRDLEIQRAIQILCRRTKNNPVLLGEAGVGKTAIAEGLAQKIVYKQVPTRLLEKRVLVLDMGLLVAGTMYRGQFEERIKAIMDEAKRDKNIIFFIDELHTIVGAGSASGTLDASNIFKPALGRGEFQCIGATTLTEYRKFIEKDSALERRFQQIKIEAPTIEQSIKIIQGVKEKYEEHHRVLYTEKAIIASCELSNRYITNRQLPDKAIDLIDEAGSRVRTKAEQFPVNSEQHQLDLETIQQEKTLAIKAQKFEKAASLRDKEKALKSDYDNNIKKWKSENETKILEVDEHIIAEVISAWTGIPSTKLTEKESQKLLQLEDTLNQEIIGQAEAVVNITKALKRARTDFKDPKKPIGSFLFLGPTGVGKTYLTKLLAKTMFNDEHSLVQIDMSEYMEKFSLSRLIGSPPGYIGHDEGGQLTEIVRKRPYSVVLFDEIEKAHPDITHLLLQVLEEGKLTDSLGRIIDFKNTIIILTSNIGAEVFSQKKENMGFGGHLNLTKTCTEEIMKQLKATFKPEFLNRLDNTIIFKPLEKKHIEKILDLQIASLTKKLTTKNTQIIFHSSAKEFLIEKGFDEINGARPLKRTIQLYVEDLLIDELLKNNLTENSKVTLTKNKNKDELSVKIEKKK
jgi:ATP-dependent Clp protease ATP-binding subunit ClpC